eukprot:scaffold10241_cov256-Chaetoceros_neogracile.AAC.18
MGGSNNAPIIKRPHLDDNDDSSAEISVFGERAIFLKQHDDGTNIRRDTTAESNMNMNVIHLESDLFILIARNTG